MMTRIQNNPVMILIPVCLAIFFAHLDVLYVNIMEARNFVTAREMVTDGNWVLTTMNGLPRYEKPPLPTWLTALSGMLFGMENLFALRLPAALAATFMVWMLYRLSAHISQSKKPGLTAALILATSFYIIFSGRNGQWDIFTHSFMLAGIWFLFLFLEYRHNIWRNALLAAAFTGFSFLSKGPVSLYALLLPFLLAYGVVYRFGDMRKKIAPLVVFLLLATATGLSWYVYVRLADPVSFLAVTQEETANWGSYNLRPFYYYWSFFTQSGIWTLPAFTGLLYPYLKNRVIHKKAYRFSLLWTLFSVVLLSVIPEKKSRYLLPVLVPLAINTAFYIEYLIREFKYLKHKKETLPVYFNFGLIAAIGVVFPVAGYFFFGARLQGLWLYFVLVSAALTAIGILIFIQLKQKNIHYVFLLTVTFVMSITALGFPVAKAFNTNPEFRDVGALRTYIEKNALKLYAFSEIAPEMVWRYGETVPPVRKKNTVTIPHEATFGILVVPNEVDAFYCTFEKDFTIAPKAVFNMNYHKNNKNRLIGMFYIVKKRS
ncbi:MAG: glycosyltransferase family 39 protein [Sinomicrobium sp.]|nr:glycosyltransferase family 39 protein [Sinomicrobium sp.]